MLLLWLKTECVIILQFYNPNFKPIEFDRLKRSWGQSTALIILVYQIGKLRSCQERIKHGFTLQKSNT